MPSDADRDTPESEALLHRALPYPTSRLAARIELVDLAAEIEKADVAVGLVASAKLETLREQMLAIKREALRVLEEARASARLHRVRCNFKKIPGKTYHLYRRSGDDLYFSMLSPADWKGAAPHAFEGSFRLEVDLRFTPIEAARESPDPRLLVQRILEEDPG